MYLLSESWINLLDGYVSLNEIFKIQCGNGDGKTDKYCFDFTLTRDANLITIVIFPMVFYAGWAGVFSYLINPLIEYRVLNEKKKDWKSCKSYKKTLFSPSFPPLFSPSSNFHFSSDSDLYNSVHFKKNSLLQRVTASVSSFSNVVVGRFSDKSRADCSGNPFLGSSKNNSKSDTGRDLAKRRETEAFETAAPIDHTAAARLCTTTTLVLSPNSQV